MRELLILVAALLTVGSSYASVEQDGATRMSTNIALVGPGESLQRMGNDWNVVDPSKLLNAASDKSNVGDIVEDEKDPFISTSGGKPRARLVKSAGDEWAETTIVKPVLHRVKRCGGGGGGDDDGDARRSRRARRIRRQRRAERRAERRAIRRAERRARRRAAKNKTTTVTRRVIQDGQVVSETVVPQQQATVRTLTTTTNLQPVVVPAGASVIPAQPQVIAAQPQVIAAQPQVVAAQPQVVAAQPQVVAAA